MTWYWTLPVRGVWHRKFAWIPRPVALQTDGTTNRKHWAWLRYTERIQLGSAYYYRPIGGKGSGE